LGMTAWYCRDLSPKATFFSVMHNYFQFHGIDPPLKYDLYQKPHPMSKLLSKNEKQAIPLGRDKLGNGKGSSYLR
jgi:hypothetical protein